MLAKCSAIDAYSEGVDLRSRLEAVDMEFKTNTDDSSNSDCLTAIANLKCARTLWESFTFGPVNLEKQREDWLERECLRLERKVMIQRKNGEYAFFDGDGEDKKCMDIANRIEEQERCQNPVWQWQRQIYGNKNRALRLIVARINQPLNDRNKKFAIHSAFLRDEIQEHMQNQLERYQNLPQDDEPLNTRQSDLLLEEMLVDLKILSFANDVDIVRLAFRHACTLGYTFSSDSIRMNFYWEDLRRNTFFGLFDEVVLCVAKRMVEFGPLPEGFTSTIESMHVANKVRMSLEYEERKDRDGKKIPDIYANVGPTFSRSSWFLEDVCHVKSVVAARQFLSWKFPEELAVMILNHLAGAYVSSYVDFLDQFASLSDDGCYSNFPRGLIERYKPWPREPDYGDLCTEEIEHEDPPYDVTTCPDDSEVWWSRDLRRFLWSHNGIFCRHRECEGHHPLGREWVAPVESFGPGLDARMTINKKGELAYFV
ncbi:MAG: hypothetical protein M1831_004118 [Alyxoria varia]|nr:MAG: hypothetical protein M1831_004118 [Alyxoria varia]